MALLKPKKLKTNPEVTDPDWAFMQGRAALVALRFAMDEYSKGGRDDAEIKHQVRNIRDRLLDIARIYRGYEKQYAEGVQRMEARLQKRPPRKAKAAYHVKMW